MQDRVFLNDMNRCVLKADAAYREMRFRDALQIRYFFWNSSIELL